MPAATTDRRLAVAAALAALFLLARDASAANPACVAIGAVPYMILTPGLYCLASDMTYDAGSGAAILVMSDDVTVDLGGFTVTGTAGPGTFAMGVYAGARRGVTVRNGTVRGFLYGVLLIDDETMQWASGGGHRVRNFRAIGNYFRGIRVEGRGNVIEGNQVADTGGTTVFGAGNYAFGIEVFGPQTQVLSNVVDRTIAASSDAGEAVGISVSGNGSGTSVEGNIVSNESLPSGTGQSFGVWVGGASSVLLIDNRFTRLDIGAAFALGTAGLYRDNVFAACEDLVRACKANSACQQSGTNPNLVDGGNNN